MADRMGNHRPELVGQQMLLVLGQREGRRRHGRQEEAVLLTGRPMQLHTPVALLYPLDAILELILTAPGDRQGEGGAQERRTIPTA
jgi:hypothetical protein